MTPIETKLLLAAATVQGVNGKAFPGHAGSKTFQGAGQVTTGTGSAVITIFGSMDGLNWDSIGTITLTLGTTTTSNSFTSTADRYASIRATLTTLTGTGASVSCLMGY